MIIRYFAAVAALMIGASAFAETTCTDAPETRWISQEDMLQKFVNSGYTIERFQVTEGNCYQMHGWDKDGKRVEIHHDPVNGRLVKREVSSGRS